MAEKEPLFGPLMRRSVAGLRISLPVGFLRAIGCVVFPIGLLWVVIDRERRSLQDIVFRTRVLYSRPANDTGVRVPSSFWNASMVSTCRSVCGRGTL